MQKKKEKKNGRREKPLQLQTLSNEKSQTKQNQNIESQNLHWFSRMAKREKEKEEKGDTKIKERMKLNRNRENKKGEKE